MMSCGFVRRLAAAAAHRADVGTTGISGVPGVDADLRTVTTAVVTGTTAVITRTAAVASVAAAPASTVSIFAAPRLVLGVITLVRTLVRALALGVEIPVSGSERLVGVVDRFHPAV